MSQNRSSLFLGLLLIAIGAWLVASRQIPSLQQFTENMTGATWTIAAGALILLIGLMTNSPGMAVPASIVAGVGGILYYQDQVNDYSSWAYMWTLIPGFVGAGSILAGLLGENTRRNLSGGLRLIVISAVLFLVFATFLGDIDFLGEYGAAILLILLGVFILARGLMRSGGQRRQGGQDEEK
jgi:peptidoglycan/LPS O-acetylase OafA/YrhL